MVSKKVTSLICVIAILAMVGAVNTSAYTFDDVIVEYWAGSGINEAIVVIDFGIDSYAFGYRWDSVTNYGKDMMDAVDAAGALDYTETEGFLNTISYDIYSNVGENGWPMDWWWYRCIPRTGLTTPPISCKTPG